MSDPTVCPKCQTTLNSETEFGMVTCTKCGELVFLGSTPHVKPPEEILSEHSGHELPPPRDLTDILEPSLVNIEIPAKATPPVKVHGGGQSSDLSDIAAFGNQDLPSLATGALVYDIQITGIDTAEVREDLLTCLDDQRLGFDIKEVIKLIRGGALNLKQINPVKASVILNRIKHLPFQVTWKSEQLIKGVKSLLNVFAALLALCSLTRSAMASEWARHEVNLKGYTSKLLNGEEDLEVLIAKKNQNKDPDIRNHLLREITQKYLELKKIYKDLQQEEEHVRFEHPEQGDKTTHTYRRFKLKSLEELENEAGVDGQLSRLKHKAEKTYPPKP